MADTGQVSPGTTVDQGIDWINVNNIQSSDDVYATASTRSEEHTSELQSHSFISYAVFCLKKKKNNKIK